MNLKLFTIAALLGLNQGQNLPPSRIIGGYEVNPQFKYPWMLTLDFLKIHQCGGMVYKKDTLITAAHCTTYDMKNWSVGLHRHDLGKTDVAENGKRFKVKAWKKHPDYDANKFDLNDVAIWKIDGDFGLETKDMIQIIDDGTFANSQDQLLITLGWGATQPGARSSKILMELKVPTYNSDKCVKSYKSVNKIIAPEVMFCAGYPDGAKDACQGDSGGPIFKLDNGKTILVGITSWGHGCAQAEFPGVYTKLYKFKSLIDETL